MGEVAVKALITILAIGIMLAALLVVQLRDDLMTANEKLAEQQSASLAWKCRDYTGRTPLKGEIRVCQKITGM